MFYEIYFFDIFFKNSWYHGKGKYRPEGRYFPLHSYSIFINQALSQNSKFPNIPPLPCLLQH